MNYLINTPNDWIESSTQPNERVLTTEDTRNFDGVELNISSQNVAIPVVYGYRRVIPPRIFAAVKTTDPSILYVAYVLSEGTISRPDKIFIDDQQIPLPTTLAPYTVYNITSGAYSGICSFEYSTGNPSNNPNMTLLGEITGLASNFAGFTNSLQGIAYIMFKFTYKGDTSPYKDLPKVTVDLFGRNLRTAPGAGTETSAASTNPAEVLLDMLTNTTYGCSIANSRIDTTSFSDLRTYFNETIVYFVNGTAQKRFTCNYVMDTSRNTIDNVKEICRQFFIIMHYTNGLFRFSVEKAGTYGVSITDASLIGTVSETLPDLSVKLNKVRVTYFEPYNNFLPTVREYTDTAALASDGRSLELEVTYDAITNVYEADAIAKILLNKTRNQRTYRFTLVKSAQRLSVGDIVQLNSETSMMPNLVNCRVVRMTMNSDYNYEVEAVGHDDAYYPPFTATNKVRFIDKIQPAPGEAILTPPATGVSTTPVVTNPPPEVTQPVTITPPATNYFTLDLGSSRPQLLTDSDAWYLGACSPTGLVGLNGTSTLEGYGFSVRRDWNNYGFRQLLFSLPITNKTLIYQYTPALTYRIRDTSRGIDAGKFGNFNKIYYVYQFNAQKEFGWQHTTTRGNRALTQVRFDPQAPDKKALVRYLGTDYTYDATPTFIDKGNVQTDFIGAPYIEYDTTNFVYRALKKDLCMQYCAAGGTVSESTYTSWRAQWLLDFDLVENAQAFADTSLDATIQVKFFIPVADARICIYLGTARLNLKRQRIADTPNTANTSHRHSYWAPSRTAWTNFYGSTSTPPF